MYKGERNMLDFISSQKIQDLNQSELDVYKYCVENMTDIPTISIQELADKAYVSKTTVVRMCKKLGFEGFGELRYFFKGHIDEEMNRKQISVNDIQKIRVYDITATLENLNTESMRQVVQQIKDKRITFFGKGLSQLVVSYAKTQLSLLGVDITSYDDATHIITRQAHKMTEKDVVVFISASGKTQQCLKLIDIVKTTEATTISVTGSEMNPLAELADISFRLVMTDDSRVDFDNKSRVPFFIFMQYFIDLFIDAMN